MARNIIVQSAVDKFDTPTLNKSQARNIVNALKRMADMPQPEHSPVDDVQPMQGFPGLFRYKPTTAERYGADMEVRAVFSYDDKNITVHAVGERAEIYKKVKSRVNAQR